ncbi:Pyruvate/Phosphoenolpyruvate kinase-like domain-containing protein [Hypomontagnella monticulosa]|nr:Pyruvate/Phosphoenolpyruvate kinase-like domain-containing protein [Hypomontagnella monticulosa]
MGSIARNTLHIQAASKQICKAFGIRLVTNPQIVQLAANAGYDALFIELEHSSLSLYDASTLCSAGLRAGITPFVRVPHQCGNGFVQRVLDGGAMGVIFPHIKSKADAEAAVSISKYPPWGKRSMTGQLPIFDLKPTSPEMVMTDSNEKGSSVFLMIETKESIQNINEIAAVRGVEVLLIGSNDLSIELGVPGQFKSEEFRSAVEAVSKACRTHGKIFGLAGIYENAELHDWALDLGVGFILAQQDSGLLARSAREVTDALNEIVEKRIARNRS